MLELCRSLGPINPVSAGRSDQQPWKFKPAPQHGFCHQLICQSWVFLIPHLTRGKTLKPFSFDRPSRKSCFYAETARPPVQSEASISENPQKHTNIVLHSAIDKGCGLYVRFQFCSHIHRHFFLGAGAKACGNAVRDFLINSQLG